MTITTGTKIADADYTITITPKDTTKKAATTTLTGKSAKLEKIDFKGDNLILTKFLLLRVARQCLIDIVGQPEARANHRNHPFILYLF